MTIDLMILGILMEKPQSAYDIKKDIELHHLDRWCKISVPSVYKKVIRLNEMGLLQASSAAGKKFADKTIYTITEAGVAYFRQHMTDLSLREPYAFFDCNVLISNITKLPREDGLELIENLRQKLAKARESCQNWKEEFSDIPFNGRAIIDQQLAVYQTLADWLNDFAEEFTENFPSGENNGNR